MKEDFENIRKQVDIGKVATCLLGKPNRGMFLFPGEKTPSIKLYPQTQSFYDFGRGTGGDAVKLWSHVQGMDNWAALQEIANTFNLTMDLNSADRKNITVQIKKREQSRRAQKKAEDRTKRLWVAKVDRLKTREKLYNNLLSSPYIRPFSNLWCEVINAKQLTEYHLDCLCGIED